MNKMKTSQILTILYQIIVFNAILDTSHFSTIPYFPLLTRMILVVVVFVATLIWIIGYGRIKKGLVAVTLLLLGISLVVMVKSDSQISIIMLLFLMIIYRDVEPRQFCKKYVEAAVVAMIVVFTLCLIGIFPNEFRYRITSSGLVRNRYYLGFINATVSPNLAFHISLAYLFYRQDKLRFRDFLFIVVPSTILYLLTDTKAAYFETILVILLFWMLKNIKKSWFKNIIGYLSILLMPFLAGVEMYVGISGPENPIYMLLNVALSHRFGYVTRALKVYPIGLWGNNITWEAGAFGRTSQLVDIFYMRCAIQYGLVFLIIIIIGFMGIGAYFKSKNNYYGCIIIIMLAVHSATDPQLLEFSSVPLLIMLLTGYKYIIDSVRYRGKKKKKRNVLGNYNRYSLDKNS